MFVQLKAIAVHDNGNGTFAIELSDRPMSTEQQKVLEQLFPNLGESVYKLLNQEVLLSSLATPTEVEAKPEPNRKKEGKSPF